MLSSTLQLGSQFLLTALGFSLLSLMECAHDHVVPRFWCITCMRRCVVAGLSTVAGLSSPLAICDTPRLAPGLLPAFLLLPCAPFCLHFGSPLLVLAILAGNIWSGSRCTLFTAPSCTLFAILSVAAPALLRFWGTFCLPHGVTSK